MNPDLYPGGEILVEGLRDLESGIPSVHALLVLVGAYRLSRCGIQIPALPGAPAVPEHALYQRLVTQHGPEAYRHYRSLLRRLISLESALEVTRPP